MDQPAQTIPLRRFRHVASHVISAPIVGAPSFGSGTTLRPLDATPIVVAPFDAPHCPAVERQL